MLMGSPLNPHARRDLPRGSDHPDPHRGSRCEVEASLSPHPDSSRESLHSGPHGDRHPGDRALTQPPGLRDLGVGARFRGWWRRGNYVTHNAGCRAQAV